MENESSGRRDEIFSRKSIWNPDATQIRKAYFGDLQKNNGLENKEGFFEKYTGKLEICLRLRYDFAENEQIANMISRRKLRKFVKMIVKLTQSNLTEKSLFF